MGLEVEIPSAADLMEQPAFRAAVLKLSSLLWQAYILGMTIDGDAHRVRGGGREGIGGAHPVQHAYNRLVAAFGPPLAAVAALVLPVFEQWPALRGCALQGEVYDGPEEETGRTRAACIQDLWDALAVWRADCGGEDPNLALLLLEDDLQTGRWRLDVEERATYNGIVSMALEERYRMAVADVHLVSAQDVEMYAPWQAAEAALWSQHMGQRAAMEMAQAALWASLWRDFAATLSGHARHRLIVQEELQRAAVLTAQQGSVDRLLEEEMARRVAVAYALTEVDPPPEEPPAELPGEAPQADNEEEPQPPLTDPRVEAGLQWLQDYVAQHQESLFGPRPIARPQSPEDIRATLIQAHFRRWRVQRAVAALEAAWHSTARSAATRVQTRYRGFAARRRFAVLLVLYREAKGREALEAEAAAAVAAFWAAEDAAFRAIGRREAARRAAEERRRTQHTLDPQHAIKGYMVGSAFVAVAAFAVNSSPWTALDTLVAWGLSGAFHETAHLLTAAMVGGSPVSSPWNTWGVLLRHSCQVSLKSPWQVVVVRHAGWLASCAVVVAIIMVGGMRSGIVLGVAVTALEAICSDLLGLYASAPHTFFCGNFGLLLLTMASKGKVLTTLQRMIAITMMRGAQSGGVVTYVPDKTATGPRGLRVRVVNGKRTNLDELVYRKMKQQHPPITEAQGPRLYCGHTRFATSSLVTMDGCHPHQWAPPQTVEVWDGFRTGEFTAARRNAEVFICHNGDFDAFKVGAVTFHVGAIQDWLERVLGTPRPSSVDSAAIAGVMDILRTQGIWSYSVRYSFLFSCRRGDLNYEIPTNAEFDHVAAAFRSAFANAVGQPVGDLMALRRRVVAEVLEQFQRSEGAVLGMDEETGTLAPFVQGAVDAFFDNDLLYSVKTFLANAKGSFGLCVSCSLDCGRQFVLAARGQTISVAFYPQLQLILYGSEQAAVQAALDTVAEDIGVSVVQSWSQIATRLDLDDLGGEICLLDWGDGRPSVSKHAPTVCESVDMQGPKVTVTLLHESRLVPARFESRLVPLERNPLVLPLPKPVSDTVGHDINEIPKVLKAIEESFYTVEGLNRVTAATFCRKLEQRLRKSAARTTALKPPNEVDVLITGCEVSLWVGEQFAGDLSLLLPGLSVRVVSSNKLLALKGQLLPHASTGHQANQHWDLTDCIALILSHSGGTFAPLAVSNLLQPLTNTIFVVSSQWDTQVGKQLRQSQWFPCIFSTNCGLRSAEPCSLTVVAMHHLLTGLLIFVMRTVLDKKLTQVALAQYTEMDIHQLEVNYVGTLKALEDIVGMDAAAVPRPTETSKLIRAKGKHWADHVIEAPICWLLMFAYILVTVGLGYPIISGIAMACGISGRPLYGTQFADAIIYILIPQWTPLLVRLVQRRPFWHRNSCRSVVIGDVPWVAQSAEAFLSKLFAVTYNNTSVYVWSANPADHLVHRFTHRIVRGVLLACGRPDGRLSALTATENSVCLSINQASSIQNLRTTCETLTIGHNPYVMPLSHHAIFLKGNRHDYLCERMLKEKGGKTALQGKSSAALTELYSDLYEEHEEHESTGDEEGRSSQDSGGGFFQRSLASPTFAEFNKRKDDHIHVKTLRAMAGDTQQGEKYFGEFLRKDNPEATTLQLLQSQHLSMQLYESRIASQERLVAFFVLFHAMARKVQQFWAFVSFGILKYEIDRSQSIMRIATTASPVSGAEVRGQMLARAAERQMAQAKRMLRMGVVRWKVARQIQKGKKPEKDPLPMLPELDNTDPWRHDVSEDEATDPFAPVALGEADGRLSRRTLPSLSPSLEF